LDGVKVRPYSSALRKEAYVLPLHLAHEGKVEYHADCETEEFSPLPHLHSSIKILLNGHIPAANVP